VATNQLVSVIIPFLNAGKFLQETIASVFAQTYEHWQLLLIDDGSSDESTGIAKRSAEEYPERVLYFDHPQHEIGRLFLTQSWCETGHGTVCGSAQR
jgi:glycosyltransferase involved in cell wall biosynthesis